MNKFQNIVNDFLFFALPFDVCLRFLNKLSPRTQNSNQVSGDKSFKCVAVPFKALHIE